MGRVKRIWYLSPMRAAKVQASLRIRTVSPEPPLLAHTSSESRGTFRQKARSLATLNGWAWAVTICHDGMLEDTNSLDAAQILTVHVCMLYWRPSERIYPDIFISKTYLMWQLCSYDKAAVGQCQQKPSRALQCTKDVHCHTEECNYAINSAQQNKSPAASSNSSSNDVTVDIARHLLLDNYILISLLMVDSYCQPAVTNTNQTALFSLLSHRVTWFQMLIFFFFFFFFL